jgi:protein-disulfide isomerase
MNKRFWMIIGIVCVVFVGFLVFKKDGTSTISSSAKPTSHITGKLDSKIKLVEYGDYECSYCATFAPVMKQVIQKYGDRISVQFRNYPLTEIHQNTLAASRAAEAAGLQNKFWEMHDLLYENQESWASSSSPQGIFESYAGSLSLNMAQYKKDFASKKVNDAINVDKAAFDKTKEKQATPTFFLNGKKIKPNVSLDDFSKLIDAALTKQKN